MQPETSLVNPVQVFNLIKFSFLTVPLSLHRRLDILVHTEKIVRVKLVLDLDQSLVIGTKCRRGCFGIAGEVSVDAAVGVRL